MTPPLPLWVLVHLAASISPRWTPVGAMLRSRTHPMRSLSLSLSLFSPPICCSSYYHVLFTHYLDWISWWIQDYPWGRWWKWSDFQVSWQVQASGRNICYCESSCSRSLKFICSCYLKVVWELSCSCFWCWQSLLFSLSLSLAHAYRCGDMMLRVPSIILQLMLFGGHRALGAQVVVSSPNWSIKLER